MISNVVPHKIFMLKNQRLNRMVNAVYVKTIKWFIAVELQNPLVCVKFYPPKLETRRNRYVEVRQPESPNLRHIVHAHCHYDHGLHDYRLEYIPDGRDFDIHYRKASSDFSDG
jgi:hypothetical protein